MTNEEAFDNIRGGYQIAVAPPFTVATKRTPFHASVDFGLRSGNPALKHSRCFALWYETSGIFQNAEDDPIFREMLAYSSVTQVIRAGRWLQVVFRLKELDHLYEGDLHLKNDPVKVVRFWHVAGCQFAFESGLETSVNVGPHQEPKEMPAKLRAKLFDERRLTNPNGRD